MSKNYFYIFLIAIALIFSVSNNVSADETTDKRIEALEQQVKELTEALKSVTNELKELKKPSKIISSDKSVDEKINILAEEIDNIKSATVVEEPTYEQKYGASAGASKVYIKDKGLSFGGYGELLISQIEENDDNIVDTQRVILYSGYKFTEHIVFNSEIEFEHSTTGENLDGKSGSASVEFALIDFLIRDEFNLRAGLLLAPFGVTNEIHEPTTFYGVIRPSVERQIIPTTWREAGLGIHGSFDLKDAGTLGYRAYAMNSFDSRGFKASGNRSLRVKGNRAKFNDIAFVGRLEYDPMPGVTVGGSVFFGNTGQNERVSNEESPLDGMKIDGFFQMYETDIQLKFAGLDLRSLFVYTRLDDADLINADLGFEGDDSVGDEQIGIYAVAAYNIMSLMDTGNQYFEYLAPFVRYEYYDTQREVPSGFSRNGVNEREEITLGFNYKPIPNVVVKAEYQWLDDDSDDDRNNQFNFGLGYVF